MHNRTSRRIFELTLFSMLGALMFASDIAMEALPNVHIVGMLLLTYTYVFRFKALIPLYVYVFVTGLFYGFGFWWGAYLYVWLPLFFLGLLIPRRAPVAVKCVLFPIVNALHGICFGILYAPYQALVYGLDFDGALAWAMAGFGFDVVHAIGNFASGFLVWPLVCTLEQLKRRSGFYKSKNNEA